MQKIVKRPNYIEIYELEENDFDIKKTRKRGNKILFTNWICFKSAEEAATYFTEIEETKPPVCA